MKKALKILNIFILIITIIAVSIIVLANFLTIIRILFFGMTVGGEYPDTIWWEKTTLQGFDGISTYYRVWGKLVYMLELPILIICIIYQIVYYKVLRKKTKEK